MVKLATSRVIARTVAIVGGEPLPVMDVVRPATYHVPALTRLTRMTKMTRTPKTTTHLHASSVVVGVTLQGIAVPGIPASLPAIAAAKRVIWHGIALSRQTSVTGVTKRATLQRIAPILARSRVTNAARRGTLPVIVPMSSAGK